MGNMTSVAGTPPRKIAGSARKVASLSATLARRSAQSSQAALSRDHARQASAGARGLASRAL